MLYHVQLSDFVVWNLVFIFVFSPKNADKSGFTPPFYCGMVKVVPRNGPGIDLGCQKPKWKSAAVLAW